MQAKTILILANSKKLGGYCLAGKALPGGDWVRPVSNSDHGELLWKETLRKDALSSNLTPCKIMDVVEMKLTHHIPQQGQPENWLYNRDSIKWVRKYSWGEVIKMVDKPTNLWDDLHPNKKDRIPFSRTTQLSSSLSLLHVRDVELYIRPLDGKKRAKFNYNGVDYDFAMTDPVYKNKEGKIEEACLTISIGEQFEGFCYKLVAGIVEKGKH